MAEAVRGLAAGGPATPDTTSEAVAALRNAAKLGGSMLATWGIALGVRILLPRYLGPDAFGVFSFADAFSTLLFVALGLGLETYIRKEISVRPEHASDFFGGILLIRLVLSAAALAIIGAILHATGRPAEVRGVVYVFGAYQFLLHHNSTLAALLQARGTVDGLSMGNIATKLLWGAGIVLALALHAGLAAIAAAFVLSELVKSVVLTRLARRHLDLRTTWALRPALAVVVASLPFLANTVAITAGARLSTSLMAFLLEDDAEVGWYGAAYNLASVVLLLAPLISWVLTPMLARAATRAEDDFNRALRRSTELILAVGVPVALLGALGSDLWVRLMFGPAFAPAAPGLALLSAMFPLTYVAIVNATALVLLNRGWTLTLISIAGLAVNLAATLTLIPLLSARFGPGGGGVACALAAVLNEVAAVGLMLAALGRRCFDRRSLGMLPRVALICALVVGLDRLLLPWPAPLRIGADAVAYLGLAALVDGARLRELLAFLRSARRPASVPAP